MASRTSLVSGSLETLLAGTTGPLSTADLSETPSTMLGMVESDPSSGTRTIASPTLSARLLVMVPLASTPLLTSKFGCAAKRFCLVFFFNFLVWN